MSPPEPGRRGVFDPELLAACISCGYCLPACPTYELTGDERSSPRGRITLMRALEEGRLAADDPTLVEQASFCLGCRACEPVCPAGVQYGELLEQWRDHQWRGRRTPLLAGALRVGMARRLPLRLAGAVRGHARTSGRARPAAGPATAEPPVGRAEPAGSGARSGEPVGGGEPAGAGARGGSAGSVGEHPADRGSPGPLAVGDVQLMLGCAERSLFPGVSRAVARLLPGVDVPSDQACCGALHAHNGDTATGEELAARLGEDLPRTILTTAGGCAAHLAQRLDRHRVVEVSEFLAASWADAPGSTFADLRPLRRDDGRGVRVTVQDSCHLRNGLGVYREPRELAAVVAEVVELPSAARCCGAAGTYSLLRPKDAAAVLDPKLDEIEALGVDHVVTVNPGCQRQLVEGLRRRRSPVTVLHLVELLARALPRPPA